MAIVSKAKFETLYKADEIAAIWSAGQNLAVIDHPQHGLISPNRYRAMYKSKPCPFCGQKMAQDKAFHSTSSKQEAIKRGYEYLDKLGNKIINQISGTYFHPNYITLDHKTNKARCPEKMFDYDNLQIMCWRCNHNKGDDNTFELQHTCDHTDALANEALDRYQLL